MKCLECGDKGTALIPENDPTFCSQQCAFDFAVRASSQYGKCEKHAKWFDVDFGCKACDDDEELDAMREKRDELEWEIRMLSGFLE